MLSGQARSLVKFKKGGACLLQWNEKRPAVLHWLLTPSQLRQLGGA